MTFRRFPRRLLALAWCLMTLWGCQSPPAHSADPRESSIGFSVGRQLPAFTVTDLAGKTHTLQQYQGRILVLHFWATWCGYCRGEIPELMEAQTTLSEQGVSVLAISVDQDRETLAQFLQRTPLPYPVVADGDAKEPLSSQYGITGLPVTFVIGRDGRIAARLYGSSDILGAVTDALQPSAPAA